MRNIIVVETRSTGINFLQDIVNRNYRPVNLQLKVEESEDREFYNNMVAHAFDDVEVDFDMIYEKDTYEETLEMVRQCDPVLVVPGSEKAVILATKLANDLNLPCNPIENIDVITLKDKMQERIAEHGLRYIRGKVITSVPEAIEYYDSEGLGEIVVKPVYSAGSVGVRFCSNKQEMVDALQEQFQEVNLYGEKLQEFVIQERINGEEYIVNTVSCDGVHRVTTIWKYHKVTTDEGGHIYDYMESINELGLGEAELVEYAYNVADAMGIRYGAVHGEYMIDDKGPVLIEVNCRQMGGNMPAEFLDRISGQHETDSILDSYLNPSKFEYQRMRGYQLYGHGGLKFFIIPKDIVPKSSPMTNISNNLKSHFKTSPVAIGEGKSFVKTQDLETTAGTVYLTHPDGYVVQKDLEFLRSIERYAFQLVLSDESDKLTTLDENETFDDIKSLLGRITAYGSTLFVTDNVFDEINLRQVSPEDIGEVKGEFDCVVVNLNESILNRRDDEIAYLLLEIINKVKVGGLIFIPESTYQYIPNGRIGVETLIRVLDLKIELPLHDINGFVIAKK